MTGLGPAKPPRVRVRVSRDEYWQPPRPKGPDHNDATPTSRPTPPTRLRSVVDRTLPALLGAGLAGGGGWVLTGHETVREHLPGLGRARGARDTTRAPLL